MEIVKYDIETAVITALAAKYADVKVVDGKSKEFAMAGRKINYSRGKCAT